MGQDDRNEGAAAGECVEHVWVMRGVALEPGGAVVEHECARCALPMIETPAQLRGEH